jgi:hypothetical protein
MKKTIIYITILLAITAVSCTKDFPKLNTNPSAFVSPQPEPVLTGVFLNTINQFEKNNFLYLWEYTNIVDPSGRYIAGDESTWTTLYINVLGNTKQIRNLYQGNPGYTNRIAITDIWECYVYAYLVGTYGPIPYSKAGQPGVTDVEYDTESTIYTSLLSRLKADAAAIKTTGDKFTPDAIFPNYSGTSNLTEWIKFANSLRLRIALTAQLVPGAAAAATSNIQDVMSNEATLLASDADDPTLSYGTATGSQSYYYTAPLSNAGLQPTGTGSPLLSDYVFTYFRSYKDPRLGAYFVPSATPFNITDTLTSTGAIGSIGTHYIVSYPIPYLGTPKALPNATLEADWGIINPPFPGATAPQNYSEMQPSLLTQNHPFYIMTYAEVCFMKAEAALNGLGGSLTADQYYYAGINANFAHWNLSNAQATAYEAQNGIKWNTAGQGFNYDLGFISTSIPNNNLSRVWIQEWINYYDDEAFEAWVLQRRTQNLKLPGHFNPGNTPGVNILYENLPDRWFYPVNAETLTNPIGYANGVKLLGSPGDFVFTTLKIEPPYTPVDWTKAHAFIDQTFVEKWYGIHIEDLKAQGIKYTVLSTY